jgi:hypothetical protein
MTYDHSQDRRQFAAECLVLAREAKDPNLRIALLDLAQKWLERADQPSALDSILEEFNDAQLLSG